jgi:hypothetical protein
MANALYPKFKESILQAGLDLASLNIKAMLVNVSGAGTLYSYSAAHDFLDDVASAARIATSGNLTGKTFTNGAFDSDDPIFSGVTGDTVEAIILYVDTGTASTSALIMYQDTGVTGLPLTPDGSDVQIVVDAAGWFVL